jgi:hypothetical protein
LKDDNLEQQLIDYLDNNSILLQQSQTLNYARWNSLRRRVWFEDTLFGTYNEYIDFVKWFISERFTWFDGLATERKVLLAPSTPDYGPHSWQYTLDTPPADWYATGFDDTGWQSGDAPFGTERNLQNTLWTTGQIYIRTRFYANEEDVKNLQRAFLYVFHDEDCLIYLNGEPVLERSGYITDYQYFEFDKNLLQIGWNTLAVKCLQLVGGQLIDVGIFVTPEEIISNSEEIAGGKYSCLVRDGILFVRQIERGSLIEVYGIDGRLVKRQTATSGEWQIALPHRGIYFVRSSGATVKVIY